MSDLQQAVQDSINAHTEGYTDEGREGWLEGLTMNGCVSGMINELIYYRDTVSFYNKHKAEIDTLVYDMMEATGVDSLHNLFCNQWDRSDPLGNEDYNQNQLAWFGYEETVQQIAAQEAAS